MWDMSTFRKESHCKVFDVLGVSEDMEEAFN